MFGLRAHIFKLLSINGQKTKLDLNCKFTPIKGPICSMYCQSLLNFDLFGIDDLREKVIREKKVGVLIIWFREEAQRREVQPWGPPNHHIVVSLHFT